MNVDGGSFEDTSLTLAKREGVLISGTRISDDSSFLYEIPSVSVLERQTLEYEYFA